jgi:hypothetical protein
MNDVQTIDSHTKLLAQFDERVIAHPALESVFKALETVVRQPGAIPLVIVVGPSGVGKSTLVRKLHQKILNESVATMKSDPGVIPIVLVVAISPDKGAFDWTDFYERFLKAANEPMIANKEFDTVEGETQRREKKGSHRALRRAVEQCIRHRGTKIVIVDEAQHLSKVLNARRLQDQMDAIKSLADLAGAQFVMVGTKELFTLLNQNGQLARRTRCIHFPRYRLDSASDRQSFLNILGTFEARLPVQAAGILVKHSEYIYERCLGCVGTLKDWLKLAVRQTIDAGRSSLDLKDLENTALSNESLIQMLQEIREGEAKIESDSLRRDELRNLLGLQKNQETSPEANSTKSTHSRRTVGERAPVRDPVGITV